MRRLVRREADRIGNGDIRIRTVPEGGPGGQLGADLGPEFSCGFLVVPENRDRPNGRTIKVAMARAKAQSPAPEPDPLVYLTGGPGGSGLLLGNELITMGLNRDRDLIVVDQRGTQNSQPALTCPELDVFNSTAMGLSIQASTTGEKDLAAVRACRDRLAGEGIDLAAFNTTENAADIATCAPRSGSRNGASTACPMAAMSHCSCCGITPTEFAASSWTRWCHHR